MLKKIIRVSLLSLGLLFAGTGLHAEKMLDKAIFAGGCFWCMEPPFEKLDGVDDGVADLFIDAKEIA